MAQNQRLRRERQLRGWSQAYVAEKIGAPADYYISRWERGDVLPSPYYQQKLCELFDKTAEDLGLIPSPHQVEPVLATTSTTSTTPLFPSTTPRSGNPFTYGNPISDPARFIGRTREVEQIFGRLRNAEFESSSIVGERRIGKTSLLKYLAHPAVRQTYGFDPAHYLFVYVDLQIVDEQTTPTRLWQRLLKAISKNYPDVQTRQEIEELGRSAQIDTFALEDVFDLLDEQGYYVALLLDEFEHVTENENFPAAFFYGLRSLAIHHHLALITSSRQELIELCHSQAIRSSPFFNIFATIKLGLLTDDEAKRLITSGFEQVSRPLAETDVTTILQLAGPHPYFLQIAGTFLFDALEKSPGPLELFARIGQAIREEASSNLAFYWHSSDNDEQSTLIALTILKAWMRKGVLSTRLQLLQHWVYRSPQTLAKLEKRSLALSTKTGVMLFNAIFGEWIWNEITDTRQNQQDYGKWLKEDARRIEQVNALQPSTQNDLAMIFMHINEEYRAILFSWLATSTQSELVNSLCQELQQLGWLLFSSSSNTGAP